MGISSKLALFVVAASLWGGCASTRGGTVAPADADMHPLAFAEPTLDVIAFGSCIAEDQPQPILDAVVARQPDLFLFLGDNIYADTDDPAVMRQKYRQQSEQPGIRKLFASTPVMATWDDHDYGRNDAGMEYPMKADAQREFLRFFAIPESAEAWTRRGVYNSRTLGPPGRRVQIIMLDTRYFRSRLRRWDVEDRPTIGPYQPTDDSTATVLGRQQWRWLEAELREPADLRLIASSIQVVAGEHGYESWSNFPLERERLISLIRDTGATGVVLLSGDRHLAEVSALPADYADGPGYPLYDITSSSLNRPSRARGLEPNRYRVGESNYKPENFGMIAVDWAQADPEIRLQIRDMKGEVVLETATRLSALAPPGSKQPGNGRER